jgi:hypothetical protein
MGGIHQLAAAADAQGMLAAAAKAPAQVVVITGKRLNQG